MNSLEAKPYALLANDFHVGENNIAEFEKNWEEMLDVCQEYNVKHFFMAGDILESRAGQTLDVLLCIRRAYDRLWQRDITGIIADGNHDKNSGSSTFSFNNIIAGCHPNLIFVDTYYIHNIPDSDVTIYTLSYFDKKSGKFMEIFNDIVSKLNPERYNILYCHQGISGGLSKISTDDLPVEIFEPFDSVLVGHYHNRKQIPDTNIEYIGSSRQHKFGEDPEKGYTILYTDGTTDFVQNEVNRRFVTHKTSFKDLPDLVEMIQKRSEDTKNMESVRVILDCTPAQIAKLDRQGLMNAGIAKLEVKDQRVEHKVEQADFKAKYDKDGIKDEYRSYCAKEEVSSEELALGLDYLDKIEENVCGA